MFSQFFSGTVTVTAPARIGYRSETKQLRLLPSCSSFVSRHSRGHSILFGSCTTTDWVLVLQSPQFHRKSTTQRKYTQGLGDGTTLTVCGARTTQLSLHPTSPGYGIKTLLPSDRFDLIIGCFVFFSLVDDVRNRPVDKKICIVGKGLFVFTLCRRSRVRYLLDRHHIRRQDPITPRWSTQLAEGSLLPVMAKCRPTEGG